MAGFWDEDYNFSSGIDTSGAYEQPSVWDLGSTQTALQNPGWQGGGNQGWDWQGGFADIGKGLANAAIPGLAGVGMGALINQLMPGQKAKSRLVDARTPEAIQGNQTGLASAGMAQQRALGLQANPTSFGLPGDPMDPSTAAGKKRYDIVNSSRAADAARGMFSTGGSAARETNALNEAVGNEYNKIWDSSMNQMQGGAQVGGQNGQMLMQSAPGQPNPWAGLVAGTLAPSTSQTMSELLKRWGMGV